MFPELIKAPANPGSNGEQAVPQSMNGSLVQLSGFRLGTNGPFQNFQLFLVYHPSDPKSHSFSTLGSLVSLVR